MPLSMSRSTTSASYAIVDAEALGGAIERVEHRAPAAEEERVGAAEAQGAAERRLVAHALLRQPSSTGFDLRDHEARQRLVGLPLRDATDP